MPLHSYPMAELPPGALEKGPQQRSFFVRDPSLCCNLRTSKVKRSFSGVVTACLPSPASSAGDGLTDLFLRTRKGIFAWRQVPRPGALPFVFLLGFLVLAAGLAFLLSTQQAVYGAPKRSTDME